MAILYVETSLPMSIAMGRDADALPLVTSFPPQHVLAVPALCLMESLSAFQRERSQHNEFGNRLAERKNQLARDRLSPAVAAVLHHLEQAAVQNARVLNEMEARLVSALEQLLGRASVLQTDLQVVAAALKTQHLRQSTDNLILHTVLAHAATVPAQPKALLTGNSNDFKQPQILALLAGAGVHDVWPTASEAAAWLSGLP